MICPSVPVAQIVPVASDGLYPARSILGSDSRPMVTTVAPTIPVLAARNMPTTTTEMPRPPRRLPNTRAILFSSSSAMRDFSRMVPIRMNSGTAIRVILLIVPKMRFGRALRNPASNTPPRMPPTANANAVTARVSATG